MTREALGIDIGGTKIGVGVVTESGTVLRRAQTPTPSQLGRARILEETIRICKEVVGSRKIAAIGVGTAGVIDPANGRISSATDILAGWAGANVADELREAFGVEVTVRNDAHAHAAGEAAFGAGIGHSTVMLVAVGTGIGGAIAVNGVPLTGAHGAAGHLGHVQSTAAEGLKCSCGRLGHVEAISSGPGLFNLYRRLNGSPDAVDARDVLLRVQYDATAQQAVRTSARALGVAIGGLVNVADPGVVVMAGGLQAAGNAWWKPLLLGVRSSVLPALAAVPVVPALLGQDAAIIGAARLSLNTLELPC